MITDTRKVFTIVALIAATGVAAVEMTRSPAQADPLLVSADGRAADRIDGAFQAAATMPAVAPITIPVAVKGDLQIPLGCVGEASPDAEAECMDVAYEVESGPYVVVEKRIENASILTRMLGYTMAIFDNADHETR